MAVSSPRAARRSGRSASSAMSEVAGRRLVTAHTATPPAMARTGAPMPATETPAMPMSSAVIVAVRLTAEELEALDSAAKRLDLSRSEAIRAALAHYAA